MDARYKKLDMDLYMDLQGKFYEKLVIGENVDFLVIFVFIQEESGLNYGLELWGVRLVKVLIFVGFGDMGGDIGQI